MPDDKGDEVGRAIAVEGSSLLYYFQHHVATFPPCRTLDVIALVPEHAGSGHCYVVVSWPLTRLGPERVVH